MNKQCIQKNQVKIIISARLFMTFQGDNNLIYINKDKKYNKTTACIKSKFIVM